MAARFLSRRAAFYYITPPHILSIGKLHKFFTKNFLKFVHFCWQKTVDILNRSGYTMYIKNKRGTENDKGNND